MKVLAMCCKQKQKSIAGIFHGILQNLLLDFLLLDFANIYFLDKFKGVASKKKKEEEKGL